jgi:hypothetical protein
MHLSVALDGADWHPPAGREPRARPAELFKPGYWVDVIADAERGLLDIVTIEDGLSLQSSRYGAPDARTDQVRGRLDAVLSPPGRPRCGGQSAAVAGPNGLRFAADYHVSPATVIEAADGYRAAFRPSADLARPYVSVSADVVVAENEATARELAVGYGLRVRSIRSGEGVTAFPTPNRPGLTPGPPPTPNWSPTGCAREARPRREKRTSPLVTEGGDLHELAGIPRAAPGR